MTRWTLITAIALAPAMVCAQPSSQLNSAGPVDPISVYAAGVTIRAASGTPYEVEAVRQLARLLTQFDLSRWTRVPQVLIQQGTGATSRGGTIRLNTRYTDDDDWQLSVYVHEQGHFYFNGRSADREAAIQGLDRLYPEAPANREAGGARTRRDTLLHLMVCLLEYDAMISLIGEERTHALLRRKDVYPWVYAQLLKDRRPVRKIMSDHHLNTY
jgi:hypothetical protein